MNKIKCKTYNKVPGIYKITNMINGKIYVGSSTNLYQRNRSHNHSLIHNKHANAKLQNSVNIHGLENFVFEIIIGHCKINDLLSLEAFYIEQIKPEYNIDKIDLNGNRLCSDDTKKLIGIKSKQKFTDNPALRKQSSERAKKNIGGWCKGLKNIHSKKGLESIKRSAKNNAIKNVDFLLAGRQKAWIKKRVKITQFDLNMNPIKEWDSLKEAATAMGTKSLGNFTTACKKGIKLYNSYWRKKE